MSAETSLKENNSSDGLRKGESATHARSEMLVLTSESYTAHRHFLIDLLPNVVDEASAAMEEMLSMNDLQLNGQPLDMMKHLKAENREAGSAINDDFGIDIDDEDETYEKPLQGSEIFGSIKCDGLVTGILQRQTSLKACGKLVDIVTNHSTPFLNLISKEKSFNERSIETSSARWRKCKRAALFDSRRVVLFFSILSSLGTLVLIYMTLRVRQAAESFVSGV